MSEEVPILRTSLSPACADTDVVKVNEKCFSDLKGALDATQDGDTVTLLNNVNSAQNVVVTTGITLNLNGKELTTPNLIFGTSAKIDGSQA